MIKTPTLKIDAVALYVVALAVFVTGVIVFDAVAENRHVTNMQNQAVLLLSSFNLQQTGTAKNSELLAKLSTDIENIDKDGGYNSKKYRELTSLLAQITLHLQAVTDGAKASENLQNALQGKTLVAVRVADPAQALAIANDWQKAKDIYSGGTASETSTDPVVQSMDAIISLYKQASEAVVVGDAAKVEAINAKTKTEIAKLRASSATKTTEIRASQQQLINDYQKLQNF